MADIPKKNTQNLTRRVYRDFVPLMTVRYRLQLHMQPVQHREPL